MNDQPDATLKPAPWTLQGSAWLIVCRGGDGRLSSKGGMKADGARPPLGLSLLALVDYTESPCGPYGELVVVPGLTRSGGKRYWTVSHILVSNRGSLVNGRRNWGLPKRLGSFATAFEDGNTERITVETNGRTIADLRLRALAPRFPFSTSVLPGRIRTFAQHWEGAEYRFAPTATGWASPARIVSVALDPRALPTLDGAIAIAAFRVRRFRLVVPPARLSGGV